MKKWFIRKCPNWLFPSISNAYYALSSKERVKIQKVKNGWLIQKGEIKLLSPTPKFLGFGIKNFEINCERFFKIEKGETVLDVGACIGDTTVPMAIKTGPTGRVIAVEPDPLNVRYLRMNLADFDNVEIIEKAVWNEKAAIAFFLHETPTGHSIIQAKSRGKSIEVLADTLDSLFGDRQVDFAKIDVQGAEVQVLEGGDKFLETTKKVLVETHYRFDEGMQLYPKVMEILEKHGYQVQFLMDNGIVYAWR